MDNYAFDRDKLKLFDDQRHEIIHGATLGKPLTRFPISNENLFYVHQTGLFLMGLIVHKYGLRLSPPKWSGATMN